MELLNPRNDFLFKRVFGSEENRDLLLHFLNAVFEDAHQPRIAQVELLNPFLDKDSLGDKLSVLDVKARTETGMLVDIEIQLRNHHDMAARTLYYWAKLFEQQVGSGDSYQGIHKTVTINLLDFSYLPTTAYHSTFHLREDTSHDLLTDACEIHFVELPKLKGTSSMEGVPALVRWLRFLTLGTEEEWACLAQEDPVLQKAVTTWSPSRASNSSVSCDHRGLGIGRRIPVIIAA